MQTSTSRHHLNGDRHLTRWQQLEYFARNWSAARTHSRRLDPRLRVQPFHPGDLDAHWAALPAQASPSRVWSDLFWRCLPWSQMQEALGVVRILDVGCGSGAYGPWLLANTGDVVAGYTGLDLTPHPSWSARQAADRRVRFVTGATTDIRRHLTDDVTLVMSQSVLEHVEHDLAFIRDVRDVVATRHTPLLQIHLVPSSACLWLYLLHGYRQYTPQSLSAMTRLYSDADELWAFGLGGRHSNRLHATFVTWPWITGRPDRRTTEPQTYAHRLRQAVESDLREPSTSPSFWALVIHAGPTRRLFSATR